MFSRHMGTGRAALLVCLSVPCGPWVRAEAPLDAPAPPASSRIEGKVFRGDGKTPVAGAIVRAFHLDDGKVYASAPSDSGGEFEIGGLSYGYVDLSVETAEGVYVGNVVVNVPPGGTAAIRFSLTAYSEKPGELWSDPGREAAGAPSKVVAGVAEIRTRPSGREFWRSPAGIAIIGGAGGAVILAIAAGGGGEDVASPSVP